MKKSFYFQYVKACLSVCLSICLIFGSVAMAEEFNSSSYQISDVIKKYLIKENCAIESENRSKSATDYSTDPNDLNPLIGTAWKFAYGDYTDTLTFATTIGTQDDGSVFITYQDQNGDIGAVLYRNQFPDSMGGGSGFGAVTFLTSGYKYYFFKISEDKVAGYQFDADEDNEIIGELYFLTGTKTGFTPSDGKVSIVGTVKNEAGEPLCTMVLANGQHMFSCGGQGEYNLEVPLDANGEITLFAFCDGLAPFKATLTPSQAANYDIVMSPAPDDANYMYLNPKVTTSIKSGWVKVSGKVENENGVPLCAMVLANGQHMFSCDGEGTYELEVPLDENGEVTLFGFCDGVQPFKQALSSSTVWVSFDDNDPGTSVSTNVSVSTTEELVVDFKIPGMNITDITHEGVTYQFLDIPDSGHDTEVGKPQLPSIGRYIAVPAGATVDVEILDASSEEIEGYTIYPAQEPLADTDDVNELSFQKDENLYQTDAFYPSDVVELDAPFFVHGYRVIILRVNPVQFNPVKKILRVYSNIRVKTSFIGGQSYFIGQNSYSSSFSQIFYNFFLNNLIAAPKKEPTETFDDGKSLLVITHPDFLEAATTLRDWKVKKGIPTEVKTTDQTGTTASDIQEYIQDAYDNWDKKPSHLLFIGDAEFIPCHYGMIHPYHKTRVGTDLYYATVDGDDYFPDIAIGRLSVDTLSEAVKRVNDIIRYEKAVVEEESFYQNTAICGEFQDSDLDKYADRRFAQTSEDMAIYLSRKYSVERIYYTDSEAIPLYWSKKWFGGGLAGNQGNPVPSYLRKPEFEWSGNHYDIDNAINNGKFLVTHRDHGFEGGWGGPSYQTGNVQNLTNGDKLPVVWSINCMTGWFDNETDGSDETLSDAIHFSEAWERNPNGGAVGVIAASRVSYSGYNDRLIWGWMDAIYPDFESSYNRSDNQADNPIWEMGQVLNYGKYYMSTKFKGNDELVKLEFEMFHWFGDPTMEIRTNVPNNFNVSYSSELEDGTSSIDVTVDQDDALICISKDGEILARSLSKNGINTITWSNGLSQGDKIHIVVTKHDYRPYEGTAIVGGDIVQISGQVTGNNEPLSGIKIRIPLIDDNSPVVYSGEDGTYILNISDEKLPTSFAILASGEGFVPNSMNITKEADIFSYTADFVMEEIPEDTVILEIEPQVHHLGDDSYSGSENSQFQQKTEGTVFTKEFEVNDFQLTFSEAEITLLAKGLQNYDNTLSVNGTKIGQIDSSPSDGSFGTITMTFDTSLLKKGTNTLEIRAGGDSDDYDDFEFTNIVIRFKGKNTGEEWTLNWTFEVGDSISSPAISSDGTLYATSGGKVYSINPDGTQKWAFDTDSDYSLSMPAIGSDGTIYTIYGDVYAINPDGTEKWIFDTFVTSSPVIGPDDTIYSVTDKPSINALNPDGTSKDIYFDISSPIIGSDGTIYATGEDSWSDAGDFLYAINPDGTEKWKTEDKMGYPLAIGADGTIYAGGSSFLYAVNSEGSRKWIFETSESVTVAVIGSDNTIYAVSGSSLYAVNSDGTQKWIFETQDNVWASPAIGVDGTIFLPSSDNHLYAINPDGTEKWAFEVEDPGSPTIGSDGTVYIPSGNKLYAISTDCGGLADSPWTMLHHDEKHTGRASGSETPPVSDKEWKISKLELDYDVDGTTDQITTYFYDSEGKMIKSETEIMIAGTVISKEGTFFTYDDSGNNIRIDTDHGDDGVIDSASTLVYDADGNHIKTEVDYFNNGITDYFNSYSYDAEGNMTEAKLDDDGDGTLDSFITYTYDDKGNKIKEEIDYGLDGTKDEVITYTYTYNSDGNIMKTETDKGNDGSINEITAFTYDANGNLSKTEMDIDNDGVTNLIMYHTWQEL